MASREDLHRRMLEDLEARGWLTRAEGAPPEPEDDPYPPGSLARTPEPQPEPPSEMQRAQALYPGLTPESALSQFRARREKEKPG